MKTDINNAVENVIAIAEVASDQIISTISNATKNAGKAIDFEITIKKLNAQKTKKIYELGEYVYNNNTINEDIIKSLKEIDGQIENVKKEKEEYINNNNK